MDIVIDGNSLFDRLIKLKIDEDILYKQFSVMKFQRVIEESILRKSKKCKIVFSKDNIYYNKDLICRIEAEGIPVIVLESRLQLILKLLVNSFLLKSGIPIEIKKGILELKNAVHKVFATSNQLLQTHYAPGEYIEEVNKSLCNNT